jgi:hypothetical protein
MLTTLDNLILDALIKLGDPNGNTTSEIFKAVKASEHFKADYKLFVMRLNKLTTDTKVVEKLKNSRFKITNEYQKKIIDRLEKSGNVEDYLPERVSKSKASMKKQRGRPKGSKDFAPKKHKAKGSKKRGPGRPKKGSGRGRPKKESTTKAQEESMSVDNEMKSKEKISKSKTPG